MLGARNDEIFAMTLLLNLIYWETWVLLFGFCGVVVVLLLNGRIRTEGLFWSKDDGNQDVSPERVQLLLFTLGSAYWFLQSVLLSPTQFPDVPLSWIAILGGSHSVYL